MWIVQEPFFGLGEEFFLARLPLIQVIHFMLILCYYWPVSLEKCMALVLHNPCVTKILQILDCSTLEANVVVTVVKEIMALPEPNTPEKTPMTETEEKIRKAAIASSLPTPDKVRLFNVLTLTNLRLVTHI
jgi:hypothetical protein